MAVLSYLQLILPLLVVVIYSVVGKIERHCHPRSSRGEILSVLLLPCIDASDTHRRRQIPDTKDRGVVQKKFDESGSLSKSQR